MECVRRGVDIQQKIGKSVKKPEADHEDVCADDINSNRKRETND